MRLSEAILAGSRLHGQTFGVNRDSNGNTCAVAAAAEAVGLDTVDLDTSLALIERFPELGLWLDDSDLPEAALTKLTKLRPRQMPPSRISLLTAIQMLNDWCGWPRELIARWVAHLERK